MCFVWLRWLVPRIIGLNTESLRRPSISFCPGSVSPSTLAVQASILNGLDTPPGALPPPESSYPSLFLFPCLALPISQLLLSAFDSALMHTLAALGLLHNVSSKTSSTPLQPIFFRRLGPHSIPSTREIISWSYSTYVLNNTPPLQTRFVFCS